MNMVMEVCVWMKVCVCVCGEGEERIYVCVCVLFSEMKVTYLPQMFLF